MIRIALAQINTTVGDIEGNTKKILEYIRKARAKQADIVAFPELAICGYPPEDLLLKKHFVDDNIKALKMIAKETRGIIAIVGFAHLQDKKIFNAAAVLAEGTIKGIYNKMDLPNYGVFDEKRYFASGEKNMVFSMGTERCSVPIGVFGISICEDIWKKDGAQKVQSQAGAKILFNISASPYYSGKMNEREMMLRARAKENKSFVCYVNLVGGQDELVFDGGSLIVNPKGETAALAHQFEEELLFADVDLDFKKISKHVKNVKTIGVSTVGNGRDRSLQNIPRQIARHKLGEAEEIYKALVLGTRDYILKNGFKKVVIGLSGGIDSALVAVIACDAIGRDNVTGISMPSQFSSSGTRSDAKKLAQNLGIHFREIPIEDIFEVFLKVFESEFKGEKRGIAEENIQARIRGNILMAFSNKYGWLVLTTGNKSEIATGYCTLYGDMAGGFAVIKDVPKTKIYQIARFRNNIEGKELIPKDVFTRAPTAELRENQKDEDSLPAYPVLDVILRDYVELNKSAEAITKKNDSAVVKKVISLVDKSEYKRRQAPPGVKITPLAFGRDRRLPITNKYKES